MTIEKQFPSGAWLISEIIGDRLIQRRYFFMTKKEAIAEFKEERSEILK